VCADASAIRRRLADRTCPTISGTHLHPGRTSAGAIGLRSTPRARTGPGGGADPKWTGQLGEGRAPEALPPASALSPSARARRPVGRAAGPNVLPGRRASTTAVKRLPARRRPRGPLRAGRTAARSDGLVEIAPPAAVAGPSAAEGASRIGGVEFPLVRAGPSRARRKLGSRRSNEASRRPRTKSGPEKRRRASAGRASASGLLEAAGRSAS